MTTSPLSAALVLSLALSLGGCAAPPASARARSEQARPAAVKVVKADEGAMIICGIERPTGSNIPRRVCRARDQMEREREAAQRLLTMPRAAGRDD